DDYRDCSLGTSPVADIGYSGIIAANSRFESMEMRRLTFGFLTLGACPPLELLEIAKSIGVDSVGGLRVEARRYGEAFEHQIVGNNVMVRDVRLRLDANGLSLSNVCGRYL